MATRHDASYFFQNVLAKYKGWFPEGVFIKHPCEGAGREYMESYSNIQKEMVCMYELNQLNWEYSHELKIMD